MMNVSDMLEFVTSYIIDEAFILVPVLWVVGFFIKKTPHVKNFFIPWILTAIGVILSLFLIGFTIEGFIQGILVAGIAVFAHQLFKETKNGHLEYKKDNGFEMHYRREKEDEDKEE